ncbi:hypothetical protein WMF00_03165 [Sorangium sp. So ce1182]
MSLSSVVTLEGAHHLLVITVIRGHKISADEQEDDIGRLETLVDLNLPRVS